MVLFGVEISLSMLLIAEGFVVAIALSSHFDLFFSKGEMIRAGYDYGTPFNMHGGMWGDVILISPLMALIWTWQAEWKNSATLCCLIIASMVSALMHISYRKGGLLVPNWAAHDGKLTFAGKIHQIYMAGALALILLFYFATPGLSVNAILITSGILAVHIFLGVAQPAMYAGDPLTKPPIRETLIGAYGLLVFATAFAIKFRT